MARERLHWMGAGYLAGALLAGLVPVSAVDGPVRSAVLAPRRIADYVPRLLRAVPVVAFAASVLVAAVSVLTPREPGSRTGALIGPWRSARSRRSAR